MVYTPNVWPSGNRVLPTPAQMTNIEAGITASAAATYVLPAAGAAIGGVKRGAAVVNATDAATVITQLNALLTTLRTAGTIAP